MKKEDEDNVKTEAGDERTWNWEKEGSYIDNLQLPDLVLLKLITSQNCCS